MQALLNALVPHRCALCGARADAVLCPACRAELPRNHHPCPRCALPLAAPQAHCPDCSGQVRPYVRAVSPLRYRQPVAWLVTRLKFDGQLRLAEALAAPLLEVLTQREAPLPEVVVPVPLHPQRLRQRGFNQAMEIARPLARRLGLVLDGTACRRLRPTTAQTGLDAAGRRRNVAGAFAVSPRLAGRSVALVDDVMTTGSTVHAVADALCRAGVAQVEVWTAARAERA